MTLIADGLSQLNTGQIRWLLITPDGACRCEASPTGLLLPGSFNPLHIGHTELAEIASRKLGERPTFEISIFNVDKPPLPLLEVERRLQQFLGVAAVVLTHAPTFLQKATLFPQRTFAIGADTASRVVDAKYHGHDVDRLHAALTTIREHGCRFLVGGRALAGQPFQELAQLPIPEPHRDLFDGIPEHEFRYDISSSDLREHRIKMV